MRTQRCAATGSSCVMLRACTHAASAVPCASLPPPTAFKLKPCRAISRPQAVLCSPPSSTAPYPISARVPALLANSWVSFISCCLPAHDVWLCRRGAGCLVPCLSHHVRVPGERGQQRCCTYPAPGPGGLQLPRVGAAGTGLQDPRPPTSAPRVG